MKIKKRLLTSEKLERGVLNILLIAEIILLIMNCYSIYLSYQYTARQKEIIQIYDELDRTLREKLHTEKGNLPDLYTQLEQLQ